MKDPTITSAYAALYPILAEAARKVGYALAIHGTMSRDLDVIAIPWIDDAVDADTVMNAIKDSCGAFLIEVSSNIGGIIRRDGRDPTIKPHGRVSYSLHLEAGAVIDLSIMPRVIL